MTITQDIDTNVIKVDFASAKGAVSGNTLEDKLERMLREGHLSADEYLQLVNERRFAKQASEMMPVLIERLQQVSGVLDRASRNLNGISWAPPDSPDSVS